jgi:hypothetical protein
MVGPGGAATVVYGDGCKVDVQPGAVTTIAPLSPCASGSNAQVCGPGHENDRGCGGSDWATYGFWGVWLAGVGFITAEAVRADTTHHVTGLPASP